MSAAEILTKIRNLGGRIQADGERLHVDAPAGALTPELREAMAEHKAEIVRRLELEQSMRRLEAANILIAILDDGTMRLVQTEADAHQAVTDGFAIYSPKDAYMYVSLSEPERRMLHSFKKRFAGTTEWREL